MISDKFSFPQRGKTFVFPRDHGSHNNFKIEWWYLVGHLTDKIQNEFSFQITFFRFLQHHNLSGQPVSSCIAHSALLEHGNRLFFEERMAGQGSNIYFSQSNLDIGFANWRLMLNDAMDELCLNSSVDEKVFLNLNLEVIKPPVIFGKDGVFRKGQLSSVASHYITFPRLKAMGTLCVAERNYDVEGEAWLDHEFGGQYLDRHQEGWDWACIQLDTGKEIMAYRMRKTDGSTDKSSKLTWILENGQLNTTSLTWTILKTWKSPHTGILYPVNVRITAGNNIFELIPLIENQERVGKYSNLKYWEGACKVVDVNGKVVGRAFLELAGYAQDLSQSLGNQDK